MPTMSNMNKPELYELCKQLQDVIIKLQFDMNCMEEENKLVNQNSENLLKEMVEMKEENKKLKEDNIRLDELWEEEFESNKSKYLELKKLKKEYLEEISENLKHIEENNKLEEKLEDKTNRLTKLAQIHYEKYKDN